MADFIALVRVKAERIKDYDPAWLYDIYGEDAGEDDVFHVEQTVYIGDTVQVDDDRNIYPAPVAALDYVFLYSGEHFQDVVDLAYEQKPAASVEDIIRCLNHYHRHDDFLDLDDESSPA